MIIAIVVVVVLIVVVALVAVPRARRRNAAHRMEERRTVAADRHRDDADQMRARADAGMTVLLTTHYMEEAEHLADRVAIMDHGRIVRSGDVAAVIGEDARSRISFRAGPQTAVDDVPAIAGAQITQREGLIEIRTDQVQEVLAQLLQWANADRRNLPELNVRSSSLEELLKEWRELEKNGRRGKKGKKRIKGRKKEKK